MNWDRTMNWDDTARWRHLDFCEVCARTVVCFNPACTERVCGDCQRERDEGEERLFIACARCGGSGEYVTCIDDVCRGAGECIHGDGMEVCRECDGEGVVER